MIIKIAVGFPTPINNRIQPVIVHNLKFFLTSISKREFLSFNLTINKISLSKKSKADKSGADV